MQQIKSIYQIKHPRMRYYINAVWDLIDVFFHAFNITVVPREENQRVDALELAQLLLSLLHRLILSMK